MANPNRQSKPDTEKSEQRVLNWSFDNEFKVLAVELLGYNSATNSLVRLEAVESADSPGKYGLLVLNVDGSAVSTGGGGGATPTYLETEDGLTMLLETGVEIEVE
jgi:hypothetical protein